MTRTIARLKDPIAGCVIQDDWSVKFGIGQATKVKWTVDGNTEEFQDTDEMITVMNCNGYQIEVGYVFVQQIGDRWLIA